MDGAGAAALRCRPRHGAVEGVVELERGGPVAEAPQCAQVAPRQFVPRRRAAIWRGVRSSSTARTPRTSAERADLAAGLDLAAQRAQERGHRIGDGLRAAGGDRPADAVAEHHQREPEARRGRGAERAHRVRGVAGQQGAGARAREARAGEARGRAQSRAREAHVGAGVAWDAQGAEQVLEQHVPVVDERLQQRAIGIAVGSEALGRLVHGAMQRHCRAVVERMGDRDLGMGELEPVLPQRQATQERRGEREGVDRRADVVPESGQRELGAAQAAADLVRGLEHEHGAPCLGERDRSRQAIGARAHDDRVPAVSHCGTRGCPRARRRRCRLPAGSGS